VGEVKPEAVTDRLREILRPYGSRFTGAIARGDLVVPQREVPKLLRDVAEAALAAADGGEASDREVFEALVEAAQHHGSTQDRVTFLKRRFRITPRRDP